MAAWASAWAQTNDTAVRVIYSYSKISQSTPATSLSNIMHGALLDGADELLHLASELDSAVSTTKALTALHLQTLPPATALELEACFAAQAARASELQQLVCNIRKPSELAPAAAAGGFRSPRARQRNTLSASPESAPSRPSIVHADGHREWPSLSSPAAAPSPEPLSLSESPSATGTATAAIVAASSGAAGTDNKWRCRMLLRLRRYLSRRLRKERDQHAKATAEAEAADWAARMLEGDLHKVDLSSANCCPSPMSRPRLASAAGAPAPVPTRHRLRHWPVLRQRHRASRARTAQSGAKRGRAPRRWQPMHAMHR